MEHGKIEDFSNALREALKGEDISEHSLLNKPIHDNLNLLQLASMRGLHQHVKELLNGKVSDNINITFPLKN